MTAVVVSIVCVFRWEVQMLSYSLGARVLCLSWDPSTKPDRRLEYRILMVLEFCLLLCLLLSSSILPWRHRTQNSIRLAGLLKVLASRRAPRYTLCFLLSRVAEVPRSTRLRFAVVYTSRELRGGNASTAWYPVQ